jgi:predicted RecA/RadA family phage recombinase
MRNHVQAGTNLTLAAPYDVPSGGGVLIGSIFGVAAGNADSGAEVDIVTEGVFTLPKVSALAISVGDRLYWVDADKVVSKTASGNTLVGVAVSAAANPSGTVDVRLNGSF